MASTSVERRLRALEEEVARLRKQMDSAAERRLPWWEQIMGTFANDPHHGKAMRLGRAYRQSFRPKTAKTAKTARQANGLDAP